MKKTSIFFIALVIVISAFVSSCNTKDDPQPKAKSNTELLTQKTWLVSSFEAKASATAPWVAQTLSATVKDNVWTFKTDGTYTVKDNATASAPTVITGTWSFNAQGQFVKDNEAFAITLLNETTFTFTGTGQNDDERYTFTH